MKKPYRWWYLMAGHGCMVLGTLGVFLPLLPTTPFILLAAACYGRGSESWAQWLAGHPRFGPLLHDWQRYGVIRPRAKFLALCLIALSGVMVWMHPSLPQGAKFAASLCLCGVSAFLMSRPQHPPKG